VLLLLAHETLTFEGAAGHQARLSTLAGLLALVIAVWAAARYWKKTRPARGAIDVSSAPSGAP
jgi:TctA family transporter